MRRYHVLAASTVLALALSACGGDGTPDSGGNSANGGEFNIAWNAEPPTLDPLATTATAARDISRNVFEPLLTLDSNAEVQTVLAESYEVSDDGQVITFTLRDGVMFHNGEEMQADDVVASLKSWIERTGNGQNYFSEAEVASEGEGTVTVTLPEPMYIAASLLADQIQPPMIMPAEIIENAPEEGVEEYVGTGPYEMTEWRTDQFVQLDRFADYVSPEGPTDGAAGEKAPFYDTITFHMVTDPSTRVSGLQSGEYDAANTIPLDNVEMLEADDNLNVESGLAGYNAAIFNKKEGPMSDVKMRQAVMAAIDPEALQKAAFTSERFYNTNGSLVPEGTPLHSDVGQEYLRNDDPSVVEGLLEEAGYDGEPIRILTSREYMDHYHAAVTMQQQLEEAGMNVELNVYDWATMLQKRSDPDAYEFFITGFSPITVPVTNVFFFESWPGWTDSEELSDALDGMTTAADGAEAKEASEKLHQAFYDYVPAMKFGDKWTVTGMRADVEGYQYVGISGDIFYNVRESGS